MVKVEFSLSERTVEMLQAESKEAKLTPDDLADEILSQALLARSEPPEHKLANRPDWQAALERSRAALMRGEVFEHGDVLKWHNSHSE
jgi:predicted transcriptional regulator